MPRLRPPGKLTLAVLLLTALGSKSGSAAAAEPPEAARARAAELYDRAVALYEHARYAEAASAFFEADVLAPSRDALSSAIAAARLAHDDLLVARAAQRAVERESSDPKLAGDARAALSEAEAHLARLDIDCQPTPCDLSIDQARVAGGRQYLLPGTHVLTATYPSGAASVEQRASLSAGSLYTITLSPAPAPSGVVGSAAKSAGADSKTATNHRPPSDAHSDKPLRPWVLFVGAGATLALTGVTVWSGVDALNDVDHFKSTRKASDRDDALSSVHRTDILLAGSVLLGGLTAYAGLKLVDFSGAKRTVALSFDSKHALLTWSGPL